MEKIEQRERASLDRDLKREAPRRVVRQEQLQAAARAEGLDARGAKKGWRTDARLLEEEGLSDEFNVEAAMDTSAEDSRKQRKSWKQRGKEKGHKKGRGKGYG
jgi:hypothetical protein